MARKFQIGDTVEVVSGAWGCPDFKVGHRGRIKDYTFGGDVFPYVVVRKTGKAYCFSAKELKLIKKKVKGDKNGFN